MKASLTIICILPLLILANSLYAQLSGQDSVAMLVDATRLRTKPQLFVHYDKNIYLPNEKIWFAAYLLNNQVQPTDNLLLSMSIINQTNRSIIYSKKFVFVENSSSGAMTVPDSIPSGEYTIVAYPSLLRNGMPDPIFYQSISIRHPGNAVSVASNANNKITKASIQEHVQFKFYPEGGQLIVGLPSYMGWESKDSSGSPIKVDAVLFRDEVPIDTISSSEMGMGRFPISVSSAHRYRLSAVGPLAIGSTELPNPIEKGVTLSVPSAAAIDTLRLKISSNYTGRLHLVVHNNQQVFLVMPNLKIKSSRNFRILLDKVPKGLASVTVFGEDFLPLAERLFYAHYGAPDAVQISTDTNIYSKKQQVNLELDLRSQIDTAALISMSVVKSNRISRAAFNDIENYQLLKQELAFYRFPIDGAARKAYTEDVLLIKGWTRYTDQTVTDAIEPLDGLSGTVTINKRLPSKPLQLTLMSASSLFLVQTDSTGRFELTNGQLLVEDEKPLNLFALGKFEAEANISINDPYYRHNEEIASRVLPVSLKSVPSNIHLEPLVPMNEGSIVLKEVTIKGNNEDRYHGIRRGPQKNPCGDYVCRQGYLNCPLPSHDINTKLPVKGVTYLRYSGSGKVTNITYIGCEARKKVTKIDAANWGKEFYAYGKEEAISNEPLYSSTLYWAPQVLLNQGKTAKFSFYTGDIGGLFNIVVQGITANGTVYTEKTFEIKP